MAQPLCRLFDLPPELRLCIYELLLPAQICSMQISKAVRVTRSRRHMRHGQESYVCVDLLRTCRSIYDEASQFLYKGTIFDITVSIMESSPGSDPKLCWLDDLVLSPHVQNVYLRNTRPPNINRAVSDGILEVGPGKQSGKQVIAKLIHKLNGCPSIARMHLHLRAGVSPDHAHVLEAFRPLVHLEALATLSLFRAAKLPQILGKAQDDDPVTAILDEIKHRMGP